MNMFIENTKECRNNLVGKNEILRHYKECSTASYIHHRQKPVILGKKFLLKVNTNVGVSNEKDLTAELQKIENLISCSYAPDIIMDHSPSDMSKPLWKYLVEMTNIPVGALPIYSAFKRDTGIEKKKLIDIIEEMAVDGINFMTLHPTADIELYDKAKSIRKIPTTSWGGGLLLMDTEINNRKTNVVAENFIEILSILKKHNITISIGSTFRPARIDEALDEIHLEETRMQKEYIDLAKKNGVNVIMEGIGHVPINMIPRYNKIVEDYNTPLMVLGPIPTDASIGFDHVSAAVGAAIASTTGNVGIINSITRDEHLGGIPSTDSILEGLKAARTVAHMINIERFKEYEKIDNTISDNRANKKTCIVDGGIFNMENKTAKDGVCTRCNSQCPLKMLYT